MPGATQFFHWYEVISLTGAAPAENAVIWTRSKRSVNVVMCFILNLMIDETLVKDYITSFLQGDKPQFLAVGRLQVGLPYNVACIGRQQIAVGLIFCRRDQF